MKERKLKMVNNLGCYNTLSEAYYAAYNLIMKNKNISGNTYEALNVSFTLNNVDKCIISTEKYVTNPLYLLGELTWYAAGDNSLSFISKFSKFWKTISDDGKTCNSAYGYIMKYKFGFNQIEKVIDLLKVDKNTRRACIIINDANENVDKTLDEQCTMFLQFLIRNNKLNMYTFMRSNDLRRGVPYDVPAFIMIQKYIANSLGIECGTYTHNATSMHIYFNDIDFFITKFADCVLMDEQTYSIDFVKLYENGARNLFISEDMDKQTFMSMMLLNCVLNIIDMDHFMDMFFEDIVK